MNMLVDRVELGFNRLLGILVGAVAVSIGLIAFLIPLNLLLVKMNWGAVWALYEAVEYMLYAGIFLGAPWVLQQGAHVRVDLFVHSLPQSLAQRLEQVVNAFGALICPVLAWYGYRLMVSEFADGTLPDKALRIPNWIMMAVFLVSFVLLAIEFLFRIRRAREIVRAEPDAAGF